MNDDLNDDRRRERRAHLVLALACVAAYLPAILALLAGAQPFDDDAVSLFGPWREWSRQSLDRGVLPLWNPHLFCGLPFMSNGQASILYPPNIVYWIFPLSQAFVLDAVAHNIALALGAFALCRALGQSRTASIVASLAWALGGGVAGHIYTGHFTWHAARAYLPWQMLLALLFLRSGEKRFALGLALLFALQIAAGYPPFVLLSAALCICVFIARLCSHFVSATTLERNTTLERAAQGEATSDSMRHMSTHAAALRSIDARVSALRASCGLPRGWSSTIAATGLLLALLSFAWVLPLRETSALSVHGSALSYRDAVEISGSWRSLVRLLAPDFFGGNRWGQWSVAFGAWEEAAYGGLLTFVLALGAPFFARRLMRATSTQSRSDASSGSRMSTHAAARQARDASLQASSIENETRPGAIVGLPRAVWWLWCLLPASLLLAMGDNTPLYRWLFDHIALLRLTRAPVRWLEVWMMAAALLAGFAFDALVHRAPRDLSEMPGEARSEARNDARTETRRALESSAAKRIASAVGLETNHAARSFLQFRWKIVQISLVVLCGALGVLTAICALSSPSSHWWMKTAQWSQVLRAASATRVQNAIALRQIALFEAALSFVISALFCILWLHLQQSFIRQSFDASDDSSRATARNEKSLMSRRQWRLAQALLIAAMALDVSALFWRSAKSVSPPRMSTQIQWPQSLARRYEPDMRWDSSVSWHASNNNMPPGIDLFNGYDAMQSRRYSAFVQKMEGRAFWSDLYQVGTRSPLQRVAGVTHTLSITPQAPSVRAGESAPILEARQGEWSLWRHDGAWPRVYLARRFVRVREDDQLSVLEHLAATPFVRSQAPVVVAPHAFSQLEPPHEYSCAPHLSLSRADRVTWHQEGNRVRVDVERSDSSPCVLVIGQSLYPGWRAWVNGRKAQLEEANGLFGAVPVPSGRSHIEVVYDTQTFRFSGFVSLCALGLVAALVSFRIMTKRLNNELPAGNAS